MELPKKIVSNGVLPSAGNTDASVRDVLVFESVATSADCKLSASFFGCLGLYVTRVLERFELLKR